REQQERQREPSLGPYRVTFLELLHLSRCPRMESFGAGLEIFNITSRIAWGELFLHSEFEDLPHWLAACVRGFWGVNFPVPQDFNGIGRHPRKREVAKVLGRTRRYWLFKGPF